MEKILLALIFIVAVGYLYWYFVRAGKDRRLCGFGACKNCPGIRNDDKPEDK
jgi:hypothetical protein